METCNYKITRIRFVVKSRQVEKKHISRRKKLIIFNCAKIAQQRLPYRPPIVLGLKSEMKMGVCIRSHFGGVPNGAHPIGRHLRNGNARLRDEAHLALPLDLRPRPLAAGRGRAPGMPPSRRPGGVGGRVTSRAVGLDLSKTPETRTAGGGGARGGAVPTAAEGRKGEGRGVVRRRRPFGARRTSARGRSPARVSCSGTAAP